MEETEKKMLQMFLLGIVQQIGLLDVKQLKEHLSEARNSMSRVDSIGPILDPTGYRNSLQDGSFERARIQIEILDHLLAIRVLGATHDDSIRAMREKQQP